MKKRIVQKGVWESKWADPRYISKYCKTREQKRGWLASVPLPGVEPRTTQEQAQAAANGKQKPERKTASSNQIPQTPVAAPSKQDSMAPVATKSKGVGELRADSTSPNVATEASADSFKPKASAVNVTGPAKVNPFHNPRGFEHLTYDLDACCKATRVGDEALAERSKNKGVAPQAPKITTPANTQCPKSVPEEAKSRAEGLRRTVEAVQPPRASEESAHMDNPTPTLQPIKGTPGLPNSKWADVPASQQSPENKSQPAEQPAQTKPVKDEVESGLAGSRWADLPASLQSSEQTTKPAEQPTDPQSVKGKAKRDPAASHWVGQPTTPQRAEALTQLDEVRQPAPIKETSSLATSGLAKSPNPPQSPEKERAPSSQKAATPTLHFPMNESLPPTQAAPDVPSFTSKTGAARNTPETESLLGEPVTQKLLSRIAIDVTNRQELVNVYQPDWRKNTSPSLTSPHWPTPLKAQADTPQSAQSIGRLERPTTRRSSAIVQGLGSELKPLILGPFEEVVRLECQSHKCLAEKAALQKDQAKYEAWREIKWSVRDQLKALGRKGDDQEDLRWDAILRGLDQQLQEQRSSMKKLIEGQRQQEEHMERLAEEVRRQGGKYSRRESKESVPWSVSAGHTAQIPEHGGNSDGLAADLRDSKRRNQILEKEKAEIKKLYFAAARRPQVGDDHITTEFTHIFYDFLQFSTGSLQASSDAHFDMNALPSGTAAWLKSYVSSELRALRVATVSHHIRPYIFMTIMSKTLCEAFRAHHYFGASTTDTVQNAVSLAEAIRPEREKETRRWLELTRQLIDNQCSTILTSAEEALIVQMVESVKSDFGATLQIAWTDAAEEKLGYIFTKALDLFRNLHRQEARYFVEMVPVREQTSFDPVTMEDLHGEEPEMEVLRQRGVDVAVFPTVYKRGDEFGECESSTTVVCKGRVVLKRK